MEWTSQKETRLAFEPGSIPLDVRRSRRLGHDFPLVGLIVSRLEFAPDLRGTKLVLLAMLNRVAS